MTPYSKAVALLNEIESTAAILNITLPETRYAQVGIPVVAMPEVTVACASVDQAETASAVPCAVSQLGTFQLIVARPCANIAHRDGTNDPERVAEVSEDIAADTDLLWKVCNDYSAFVTKRWSVSYTIVGELGITTCTLITGID